MTAALTLRPVDAGDQPFLLALVDSTREDLSILDRSVRSMLVRMQYEAQVSDYRRRFRSMDEYIVLAGGIPAGRLYLARGRNEIRLVDISLLPAFRRQGIGSQVLARLQEECAQAGLSLRLHVIRGNPAEALYRRLGFQAEQADGMHQAMEWHPTLQKE